MNKKLLYICIGMAMLFIVSPVFAQTIDPQYIFVRKNPMGCNPSDCRFLWNMDNPNTITDDAVRDITDKIGTGNSTNTRKIGVGVVFNYWIGDFERNKQSLIKLLEKSKSMNIPVFIVLDGATWWDKRPDLWYWWDPTISTEEGEKRKNNVEWTCWNSSCAIKKAWRNWGSELEVKPAPNLASPTVINETKESLNQLIPIISDWYKNLPVNQRFLLGGVSLATELDIGANYYYYPQGIKNANGLTGSTQIGYNAIKTAGIKSSGNLTTTDLNSVITAYQTTLNKLAIDLGIPRNKLFNHNGGKGAAPFIAYPSGVAFESLDASVNNYAAAGWSFYGDVTANPQNYPDLIAALEKIAPSEWSSAEWLSWAADKNGWMASLRNSLNFRNNRFINIANWEEIKDKPYIIDAIKTVASENPSCWVTSPSVTVTTIEKTATISWQKGSHNDANYFQYSATSEYTENGALKNLLGQDNVSAQLSHTLSSLSPGTYYWLLTADGCNSQRRNTYGSFEIRSTPSTGFGDLTATSTPTSTPSAPKTSESSKPIALIPGDLNNDGKVNMSDFTLMIEGYGSKYTMYEYNNLVKNFNK